MTTPAISRPLRADAARNRALLLAAAADEFAEHGLEASVADIARRAGALLPDRSAPIVTYCGGPT